MLVRVFKVSCSMSRASPMTSNATSRGVSPSSSVQSSPIWGRLRLRPLVPADGGMMAGGRLELAVEGFSAERVGTTKDQTTKSSDCSIVMAGLTSQMTKIYMLPDEIDEGSTHAASLAF
ncbi:hypothetical protein PG999_013216 [Apiospora kogelbergensis]|uniref:Uncharacterized protein n=1 Tax=Apiospora kogelbergensis TaxID=1337665 RepID=A0AAW0QAH0_9PEZI